MYSRDLEAGPIAPLGGSAPVVGIANRVDTLIPGTGTVFGSAAPPSAAGDTLVSSVSTTRRPDAGGHLPGAAALQAAAYPARLDREADPDERGQTFTAFGEGWR